MPENGIKHPSRPGMAWIGYGNLKTLIDYKNNIFIAAYTLLQKALKCSKTFQ